METSLLSANFDRVPLFLVWLVAAAIALKQRRQHPEVSRPVLFVVVVLLVVNVVDLWVGQHVPAFARERELGSQGLGWLTMIEGIILIVVTAAGWALVLRAAWRADESTLPQASDR